MSGIRSLGRQMWEASIAQFFHLSQARWRDLCAQLLRIVKSRSGLNNGSADRKRNQPL